MNRGQTSAKESRNSPSGRLGSTRRSKEGWIWIPTGDYRPVPEEKRTIRGIRIPLGRSLPERGESPPFRSDLNSARASSVVTAGKKSTSDFIPVTLPARKFYLRVFPPSTLFLSFSLLSSLFFIRPSWTLSKFYRFESPSSLHRGPSRSCEHFPGNVSNSFMMFSCIVKIRKLLPFVPPVFPL